MRILLVLSARFTSMLHPLDLEARDKFKEAGVKPILFYLPKVEPLIAGFTDLSHQRVDDLIAEMERQQAQHIVFNTWPQEHESDLDWDMLSLIYTISSMGMEKDVRRMVSYLVHPHLSHPAYCRILDHVRWQRPSGPLMAESPREVFKRRLARLKDVAHKAAA